MNILNSFKKGVTGIVQSLSRYPVTILWLLVVATLNAMQIQNDFDLYSRWLYTALTGVMLAAVAQHLYEHFFVKENNRWLLAFLAVVLAILYYFSLPSNNQYDLIYPIRTIVLLFALFIAFIWIPTIKSDRLYFHSNFLIIFESVMMTFLMAVVLSIGVSAILGSVDFLLFNFDSRVYGHAFNIIGTLFAPIYFLSLIPNYKKTNPTDADHATKVPRFLEILLVYIVIPLVAIYTLVLTAYVVLNIGGEFWTNNLLEPLLVSYAIIVIVVYLLVCNIDHKYSRLFRRIFPKIMLVVVLFQTAASILRIQNLGITHGRYYVILFGIFATVAAIIFSFFPKERSGWIAPVLIALSLISVAPVIDAFSVGRGSQQNLLERKLQENDMLVADEIVPNSQIPLEDKVAITKSVDYLTVWGDVDQVSFLPDNFDIYSDFNEVFGFNMIYSVLPDEGPFAPEGRFVYLDWEGAGSVSLEGADYLLKVSLYNNEENRSQKVSEDLNLIIEDADSLILENNSGTQILRFEMQQLFEKAFSEADETQKGGNVTLESMMETQENEQAKMTVIITQLEEYNDVTNGELFVIITIK
ncbi:DUF4153 domain-containing protein [Jeotgalibaca sp. A127]|uniref:DUF4153 domain-containing protein n=1 Tax=Jeotgalibaca sp. A127 TaxID=3457324 RepID=UPI003FD56C98